MKTSKRLFSLDNIPIYVGYDLVLFLALVFWYSYQSSGSIVNSAIVSIIVSLLVFNSVLLHELGHARAAKTFGISTKYISLRSLGGVAGIEKIPKTPFKEFVIAIAGPAANFVLMLIAFIIHNFIFQNPFIDFFFRINLLLSVFNLAPALPMDGGRILRATLGYFFSYKKATNISVSISYIMCVAFFMYGAYTGRILLICVAVFISLMATIEKKRVNELI